MSVKNGPTMTPEQERQWEEDLKSRPPRGPRCLKGDAVRRALHERFPDRIAPRGGYTEVADSVGVTRAYVQQIAAQDGFTQPRLLNTGERPDLVLMAVAEFRDRNGYSPSLRGICRETGIPATSVAKVVKGLESKGLVRRQRVLARAITLTPDGMARVDELKGQQ